MIRAHLRYPPEEEAQERLQKILHPNVQLSWGEEPPGDQRISFLVDGRPDRETLENHPELEVLIIPWSGVPGKTRRLLREFPEIQVHNLHHNAVATAELAVALLVSTIKKILPYDRTLREGDWCLRYQDDQTLLLDGRQALILGYGAIGQRVGSVLKALGLEVKAVRRNPDRDQDQGVLVYPPEKLGELLPGTQVLILSLPLTEETRGLIGEEELDQLPPDAVLVNVSRGPIIDQKALYRALREGKIFGAGLDVWYNYPDAVEERKDTPPADYPFHELDQVVLSPHRGGKSPQVELLRMEALAASLNAAALGNPIPNAVDLDLGY